MTITSLSNQTEEFCLQLQNTSSGGYDASSKIDFTGFIGTATIPYYGTVVTNGTAGDKIQLVGYKYSGSNILVQGKWTP